jgi:hypothetical protein
MAAYEDFNFFQTATLRAPVAARRDDPSPSRDALRAELERLHFELRSMRRTLDRQRRWRERIRRLVDIVVPRSSPTRRTSDAD